MSEKVQKTDLPAVQGDKPKKQLAVGPKGFLVPNTLDTQWQMANIFANSGMAPKGMEKVATLFTAMQLGAEVGLAPMQAIQNIAVVNGRPTIWGDAQLALVKTHSDFDYIKERIEGTGDNMTAVCEVKRKSDVMSVQQTFSVADAKRAQLWNKQGPWQNYPKRMLQMRARGFALRDAFPDVLKGLAMTREEAIDMIETESGSYAAPEAQTVNEVIKKVKAEKEDPVKDVDVDTGEVLTPEDPWEVEKLWINLRTTGFAKYVEEHLDALRESPVELQEKVRTKWKKLYYEDRAFPIDPEPDPEPEDPFLNPEVIAGPEKKDCPDRPGTTVFTDYCDEECPKREGCPAWE